MRTSIELSLSSRRYITKSLAPMFLRWLAENNPKPFRRCYHNMVFPAMLPRYGISGDDAGVSYHAGLIYYSMTHHTVLPFWNVTASSLASRTPHPTTFKESKCKKFSSLSSYKSLFHSWPSSRIRPSEKKIPGRCGESIKIVELL